MEFDIAIRNGMIVDGTGNPWFRADVGVSEGKITTIGTVSSSKADEVVDARGMFVAPGFIDIHTHSDLALIANPGAESAIMQGVTTHCTGNCGSSAAPINPENLDLLKTNWGWIGSKVDWNWCSFGEYMERLQGRGLGINVAPLVGHHAIRLASMGYDARAPTRTEMDEMKAYVDECMKSGAFGLSTGLVYPPGCFAETQEIVELCKVAARHGGIYTSHIRGERETIVEAVKEAIAIGEKAGIPVQISHNCPKYGAWGRTKETLPIIEEARKGGLDVTVDNDVHTDLGPLLQSALPQWTEALGIEGIVEALRDPKKRERIKREVIEDRLPAFGPSGLLKHGRWDRIFLLTCPRNKDLVGVTIQEVAKRRSRDPFDVYLDLIMDERGEASAIFDYIDERDVIALLKHPLVMICSDGAALPPPEAHIGPAPYTPCSYGEFPGVLERYVRDRPVLPLEEAIRKMTSFPAQKLGLKDRGMLREGMWADITIFDLSRIRDRATNLFPHTYPFENYPHRFPEGIEAVLVNGEFVVRGARPTGNLPGKVLRREGP